jgi:hypothetical protein
MLRKICLTISLLLFAGGANAVVVNDKDWYQVSDLTSNSWNDFDAIFDTSTGLCDAGGCLLGATNLTGYIWASNADVNSLISHYFAGTGLTDSNDVDQTVSTGVDTLDSFFGDFSPTFSDSNQDYVLGLTRETITAEYGTAVQVIRRVRSGDVVADSLKRELHIGRTNSVTFTGGWVYAPVSPVPVPAAIWLFGTALIGLIGFGKRRKTA